jgi:2-polyprenyl-3-methyl-5-hydroxy-6-metoxy-1,4-benzoquinol methylase
MKGFVENSFYKVYECEECGSFQTDAPKDDSLSKIYDSIYKNSRLLSGYKRYHFYANLAKYARIFPFLKSFYFEKIYFDIWKILEIGRGNKKHKVAEIGSGLGYMTHSLRLDGYEAEGIDISKEAVNRAINSFGDYYKCKDICISDSMSQSFYDDIICMEIIEHLPVPINFFKSLLEMVKPEGRLIVTTPAIGVSRMWASTEPPVHLTQFTERGLSLLAERLNCNLTFYSAKTSISKNNNNQNPVQFLPGEVLTKNYEPNLDYFDNGKLSLKTKLKIIAISFVNFFRFRVQIPIVVSSANGAVGSYVFTLTKKT